MHAAGNFKLYHSRANFRSDARSWESFSRGRTHLRYDVRALSEQLFGRRGTRVTESAGNPQDLLSDPSPTFSEEDDDGIGDEPIDEFDEIEPVAIAQVRRRGRSRKDCRPAFACATTPTTWTTSSPLRHSPGRRQRDRSRRGPAMPSLDEP